LGLNDVSQLLVGSESVEAGLFQELEKNSDNGRPIVSLFTVLEITHDGRVRVWQIVLRDWVLLLNVVNRLLIKFQG
jgi:hypothetical protein